MPKIASVRQPPWFVIFPVLVSLGLGLWGLDTPGLWYDERVTAETTMYGPFIYPWDIAIVPYYFSAWVWTLGGLLEADAWLRGLSVVATLIGVAATSLAARRLAGTQAGLIAGLLLALMPGVVRFSQEARVYAIGLGLAAVATWFLVEAMSSHRRRWWWGYAGTLFFLAPIAPFALTIVVGHAVLLVGHRSPRQSVRAWLASLLALVPGVALQLFGASKSSSQHDWIAEPTLSGLLIGLTWPGSHPGPGDVAVILSIVVIGSLVLALSSARGIYWGLAALVGICVLWLTSAFFINFWIVRSSLPLAVFLAIGAGIALSRVAWWQVFLLMMIFVASSWPEYAMSRQEGGRAEDVKVAAAIVDREGQSGDTVNTKSRGWLEFGVKRYSVDPERYLYGESSPGRAWVFSGDARSINCDVLNRWDIPGKGELTLCAALPQGWSADFQ